MCHSMENAHLGAGLQGPVFGTREVGSRYATRVRVQTPQGSCFDGQTGVIVKSVPSTTTVMVRMDKGGPDLPFSRRELVNLP